MSVTQPVGKTRRATDNRTASRFYQLELDALRFLAFTLVFCRHVIAGFGLAKQHQATGSAAAATIPSAGTMPSASYHLSPVWEIAQSLAQCCAFGACLFLFLRSFLITLLLLLRRDAPCPVAS